MLQHVITSILTMMQDDLNDEQFAKLKNVLSDVLVNYQVEPRKNELMEINDNYLYYLKIYLAYKRTEGKSDGTLKGYYSILNKFLIEMNKAIDQITEDDIFAYLSKYKKYYDVTNRHLNYMRIILNGFFGWLVKKRYITYNPVCGLGVIKSEKKIQNPFDPCDIEKLKDHCKIIRDRAIIYMLLSTGIRVSEMTGLNIDDVDFNTNEIVVFGKGKKYRKAYMSKVANMYLKQYLNSRCDNNPALFVSDKVPYERLSKDGVEARLRRLGKAAGVPNVHPHRFRRTFVTDLLNKGMPIQEVSTLCGHSSVDMTYEYYSPNLISAKYNHEKFVN